MHNTITNYWGSVLKTVIALLCITILQANTTLTIAQRVTLSEHNARLSDIIKKIRTQSGYDFIYNEELVNPVKGVDVQVEQATVAEALRQALLGQALQFSIENKLVVIRRKEAAGQEDPAEKIQLTWLQIKVRGVDNAPLVGATVTNMRNGTEQVSDERGEVQLNVMRGDVIHVGYLGYQALETTVTENIFNVRELIVGLQPTVKTIDDVEVVVNTGYQKIRPEQSTGAVSQINTKDFEAQISTDFLSGLTGKVSGVMINNDVQFTSTTGGKTSSKSLFNIRGISTITGNQSPLIVIDGFPTELTLDMIDPNEIKSVTVLKDAAAATVYGVRASNGVIVIERKQAAVGQPRINFRATAGITPKENYSRYRWAKDASAISVDYDRDVYASSVNANTWDLLHTQNGANQQSPAYYIMAQQAASLLTEQEANAAFDALKGYNNADDYRDQLLRTASTQQYHIDISGGGSKATYYFTSNYTRGLTNQLRNDNQRFVLSGRSNFQITPRFSAELMTDYVESSDAAAPVPGIDALYGYERLQDAAGNPLPVMSGSTINPFYNEVLMGNGLLDYLYYPLVDINEVSDKTRSTSNRTTLNLNYRLVPGVTFTLGGIYEGVNTKLRHYATERSSEAHQYIDSYATADATGAPVFNIPKGGFLQENDAKSNSYTIRAQLNYDKTIAGDHSLNGIVGAEVRNVSQQGGSAAYFGYSDQTLLQQPVDYQRIAKSQIIGSYISRRTISYDNLFNQLYTEDRFVSAYANMVYSYKSRYSLTGSMRIDQSNLFGTDPKYRYKPLWSLGGAWNVGNEDFLKDNSVIRQLKLRAAYGFNGNVAKLSLPRVIAQRYNNSYTSPISEALRLVSLANSGLRWEQTKNLNFGLDYGLIGRISGSVDVYRKTSTDLLSSAQIDPTIGASPTYINNASIINKGTEFTLRADWIRKPNFNWNTGLVLSHNTSEVTKIYQKLSMWASTANPADNLNNAGYIEGKPVGALYAYRWGGLDETGRPLVLDENGNASTDLDYDQTAAAFYYNGTSIPTWNGGLSNRVDVGDFYFYAMLSYYGGFKVQVPRPNPSVSHPLEGSGDYWKAARDEQHTDVMALPYYEDFFPKMVYNNADVYMVNGSYITLRDVTASYTLHDKPFLKQAGLRQVEFKLQASNIWTKGFNSYNYSMATGSYAKRYLTPTYSVALFATF